MSAQQKRKIDLHQIVITALLYGAALGFALGYLTCKHLG